MAKEKEPKEQGVNRRVLKNAMEAWKRPKVDTKDPQAIAQRIEEYLNYCAEQDITPGVAGCASWLGVTYSTLQAWHIGTRGSPEHQAVAAKFYGLIQNVWEQNMNEGIIDKISGIFYGKAFFGLRDTQEIVVQTNGQEQIPIADLIADSKRLADAGTIEAEYRMIEDDPNRERAVDRQIAAEARKEAVKANQPIRKAKSKEYHKQYYKDHKEHMDETRRINKEKAAERAQKAREERRKNFTAATTKED